MSFLALTVLSTSQIWGRWLQLYLICHHITSITPAKAHSSLTGCVLTFHISSCGAEGKCFSFDHRAEGYGRGEGAAILLVKRLDDALRNHDPVRALIRETAVNQDGRTATIAAPDENAQYDLIRTCYERARLNPLDTLVVEAHGTGTKVGDPIEARTIGRAFRPRVQTGAVRPEGRAPIYLASVKTNIGHTEAASGVAAIIKMVKSLETREIAPSINFEKANPDIDMDGLGLEVRCKPRSSRWGHFRLG